MVSPRGRGYSGGTHGNITLSGGRGSHHDDGRSSYGRGSGGRSNCGLDDYGRSSVGASEKGRGGTTHPGSEALPPRVFTILMSEKEKKGIGRGGGR